MGWDQGYLAAAQFASQRLEEELASGRLLPGSEPEAGDYGPIPAGGQSQGLLH